MSNAIRREQRTIQRSSTAGAAKFVDQLKASAVGQSGTFDSAAASDFLSDTHASIPENIQALFDEVLALSPLFKRIGDDNLNLTIADDYLQIAIFKQKTAETGYKMTFYGGNDISAENYLDSTSTVESLRAWGFALPFDLDVKAFVANVVKPVVDKLLSNNEQTNEQAEVTPEAEAAGTEGGVVADIAIPVPELPQGLTANEDDLNTEEERGAREDYLAINKKDFLDFREVHRFQPNGFSVDEFVGLDDDMNSYHSEEEEEYLEYVQENDPLFKFALTAFTVEKEVEAYGGTVAWGDFDASAYTGELFDSAAYGDDFVYDSVVTPGGIVGQIADKIGMVVARVRIEKNGMLTLLAGANGTEQAASPTAVVSKIHGAVAAVFGGVENRLKEPDLGLEASRNDIYDYEISADDEDDGFVANFKNKETYQGSLWSKSEEGVKSKVELVIATHKNSPYIGKKWASEYGGVVNVSLNSLPTLGEGSEQYQVTHKDGVRFNVLAKDMAETIKKNEFLATPEGQKIKADENAAYKAEQDMREKARIIEQNKKDALELKINNWLDTTDYTPMQKGAAIKILSVLFTYPEFDSVLARVEFIEKRVGLGDKPENREENKIKEKTRTQWNRMDGDEQSEHDHRIRESGTKTVYSIGNYDVTKAEYDYANYLLSKVDAETNGVSDTSDANPIVDNEPKSFDTYLSENDNDAFEAAKDYFGKELKGRVIKTVIGDVLLHSGTLREMKRGMKSDSIKAALISSVPKILMSGIYKGRVEDSKHRSDFIAFHFFELDSIEVGDYIIDAGVTVGERSNKTLVCDMNLTAYGLGHSLESRWKKKIGATPTTVKSHRELPQLRDGEATTLDSTIDQSDKGINIIILNVFDKKTGERIYDLEDNMGQDGHENQPKTENEPVPVPSDSDETITPESEGAIEADPIEEPVEEVSTLEDLVPVITGNPETEKQKAKLAGLQRLQEQMKSANKVLKNSKLTDEQKKEALEALGYGEAEVYKLMKPDFAGRMGFSYHLTNNNAVISSTQKRISQLEAQELAESQAASGDRETSYDFDGGTIDLDYGDDRLRVNFDSKPGPDMIAKLKQNGFKWSPTNTAWQRQLTDNAISTANYLFSTNIKTAAAAMNEEVNKPRGDVIVPAATETLTNPIKAGFEAELKALTLATDIHTLDQQLDDIMERIEAAGLSDALDAPLRDALARMTYLLAEAENKAA